jgi:YidC/Oxa1 family membrane protein insertase
VLDPLYRLVASAILMFHGIFTPIFGYDNFFSWALAIVFLTITVRLLLFPLFVKQIKSQRTMQMMQPRIKEIREKYKNDKTKMNAEMMALQKEHGNPLLGCLPIFAQIPLFIALFHVLRSLQPVHWNKDYVCQQYREGAYIIHETSGLNCDQVHSFSFAKLFGTSLSASFRSPAGELEYLGANPTAVKVVAAILIVVMAATTYLTQRQIMGRNGPVDPSQAMQQKIILYLIPGMLLFSGTLFPTGVLVYWLTTNLWSMGQQFFVLRRMPPVIPLPTGNAARKAGAPTPRPAPTKPAITGGTPKKGTSPGPKSIEQKPPGDGPPAASNGQSNGQNKPDGAGEAPPRTPEASAPASKPGAPGPKRKGKTQRKGGRH